MRCTKKWLSVSGSCHDNSSISIDLGSFGWMKVVFMFLSALWRPPATTPITGMKEEGEEKGDGSGQKRGKTKNIVNPGDRKGRRILRLRRVDEWGVGIVMVESWGPGSETVYREPWCCLTWCQVFLSDILRCSQARHLMGGAHRVESFENKQVSGQTSSVFNPGMAEVATRDESFLFN